MAAPNIVGVTTITGITTAVTLTTATTSILSNAASSNQVYKINTILASNKTGGTVTVTTNYNTAAAGAGTNLTIASGIDIVTKSALVVLDKASSFYLEENRSITASASANTSVDLVISYEVIS